MAKKKANPETVAEPAKIVINDFKIEVRSVDRSRKDLDKWRQALLSAESIVRPSRKLLYDLYADIVLDDHLRTVMDQRRLAITNTSLIFQNKGKEVESINEVIAAESFEILLNHLLDARFYGHSLIYSDFQNEVVQLVPRANVFPQKSIVTRNPHDEHGINYTERPFQHLYVGAGQTDDLGLILLATPLVLIKRGNLSDWAQFNEIFGMPLRKGVYDPNMPGQREQLERALAEAGAMAHVVVPQGAEVDFVSGSGSATGGDTYERLYEKMEEAISKLIVGQTMTTENGASRSQAEVHERIATRIAQSDRRYVLRYLNGKIRQMLIDQGFTEAAKGEFQFMEEEESLSILDQAKLDIMIHKSIGKLKKQYFVDNYNAQFVDMSDDNPEPDKPDQEEPDSQEEPEDVELSIPDDFFD